MTDINELDSPSMHQTPVDECPFCPIEEDQTKFKTYPGEANNSGILSDIMNNPAELSSKQANARPKNGETERQGESSAQPKPTPIWTHSDSLIGAYSCEAHHLISGKQCMAGHAVERWIDAGKGTVKKDTGYSINNADNGIWLPSIPESMKGGTWGGFSHRQKQDVAFAVMQAKSLQFHKGHHSIPDPEGVHDKYDEKVRGYLEELDENIEGWSKVCFLCEGIPKEGPFDPNWNVHNLIDGVSRTARSLVSGPPCSWEVFISRLAMDLHRPMCQHLDRNI